MQVVLAMFRSDGDRRSFSLHKEQTIIGRREDCDLRIPLGEISRKHCRILQDGDSLRVEDLGSSNGTYHNGTRVQEAVISPGDTIQIGSIAFVVQIDGTPADDELQPVLATPPVTTSDGSGGPVDEDEAVSARGSAKDKSHDSSNGDGEDFDPMAVLQGGDSQVDADALDIDLEQSSHGENAATEESEA
jgi:pSer/pThr/pTyr-binding forkhead associated (FHA) protein